VRHKPYPFARWPFPSVATRPSAVEPPATESEIAANLHDHARMVEGAFAPNTERACRADIRIFTGWCLETAHASLPAAPRTVAAFVDAMAESRRPATVRRYVTSIAGLHRAARLVNPCDSRQVKIAVRRMHRAKGRAQQQAAPISDRLVERMLRAAGSTKRDLRNKALLVVAYSTLARGSELVAMRVEDLEVEDDGFATIVVRRSKTDQQGGGVPVAVTPDAMLSVRRWLDAAGIKNGLLFRAVLKGGRIGGGLDPRDVSRLFKAMARAAGLSETETARISGHSTRVGGAQDLMRYGGSIAGIMKAGRWKTAEMVARYTARAEARQSLAVQIMERRINF
jgi:integrase